ncbi:hypothetical protein BCR43DRAFT_483392 [Syncephalastrum racemosum]|uniref:Uncharacterized protein n=1 Tax=Syncephalastrum racemosum TaxID=13706 RepID=A0A1X2HV78_SYNRA|nr:hypothetical protein BCR43DRAFT_483392 [Syncephalastrum racemosum]
MCWSSSDGPKWKREVVRDHKFDYVDMDEFYDPSCMGYISYAFVFLLVLKSVAVYLADLWSAISLLALGSELYAEPVIPSETSKWIFLASIIASFLLLGWDIFKAKRIIASRDISYAFTSIIASRYYSLKNYRYHCLFRKISNSRKRIDKIAFFIFFTLKGWKRLFVAEAPRQIINIVTLTALVPKWFQMREGTLVLHNKALGKDIVQQIMTGTMAFSIVIFGISFILVCIAAIMYIPLLCHIRGNLKEYCCHKVDKRILELLQKQARKRVAQNHAKKWPKKAAKQHEATPKPTLPNVDMEPSSTYNYHPEDRHYFARRYSGFSNQSSDQLGLMAHVQPQPWSSQQHLVSPHISPLPYNSSPQMSPMPHYHHQYG